MERPWLEHLIFRYQYIKDKQVNGKCNEVLKKKKGKIVFWFLTSSAGQKVPYINFSNNIAWDSYELW